MDKDSQSKDKKLVSEFNEALLKIKRLHNSWILCNGYRGNGGLTLLRWELDTVWDELYPNAIKKNPEFEKENEQIDESIEKNKKEQNNFVMLN